jgi:hypothetical protein
MSRTFDRWLKRQAPRVEIDAAARRLILARVEDRLGERQRTRRRVAGGSVLALVLALMIIVGDTGQLGSTSRDLTPLPKREDFMYMPIRGQRSGVKIDGPSDREFWEQVVEQRVAGLGEFHSLKFVELEGKVYWFLSYAHVVDGELSYISRTSPDLVATMDRTTGAKMIRYLPLIDSWISDGTAVEVAGRRIAFDGREVWLRIWEVLTPDGVLRYGSSEGIPPNR